MTTRVSLIITIALCSPFAAFAQAAGGTNAASGSSLYAPSGKGSSSATIPQPKPETASSRKSTKPKSMTQSSAKAGSKSAKKPSAKSAVKSRSKPAAKSKGHSATLLALNGRWQDSQCIPLAAAAANATARLFVLRRYEFNDERKQWALQADVFDSERCNVDSRLLTYTGSGSFVVTGASSVGKNVFDATFKPTQWDATPFSRDGTLALFNARCGAGDFTEGRTIDLSASGCALLGIASTAQVKAQNELVRIDDGQFFLGAKTFVPGFADERPTQLSSYGLTRL